MVQTIEAVYENGVLRPIQPLEGLVEHCRVRVTVEAAEPGVRPWACCVGILPDEDADEMRQIIEEEFERVNPDEWR